LEEFSKIQIFFFFSISVPNFHNSLFWEGPPDNVFFAKLESPAINLKTTLWFDKMATFQAKPRRNYLGTCISLLLLKSDVGIRFKGSALPILGFQSKISSSVSCTAHITT
jgi:hypothetical protein